MLDFGSGVHIFSLIDAARFSREIGAIIFSSAGHLFDTCLKKLGGGPCCVSCRFARGLSYTLKPGASIFGLKLALRKHHSNQVTNYSPGYMEQAPSRGQGASPQSGLGADCKLFTSRNKPRGLGVRAQARRISTSLSFSVVGVSPFLSPPRSAPHATHPPHVDTRTSAPWHSQRATGSPTRSPFPL